MSATDHYDTNVTDEQWELLASRLPERTWQPGGSGRPPMDIRQALNGILYLNKTAQNERSCHDRKRDAVINNVSMT